MTKNDKIFITIGVIALIASAGLTATAVLSDNKSNSSNSSTTSSSSLDTSTTSTNSSSSNESTATDISNTSSSASIYNDGSYTATASYAVPHSYQNSITVKITVSNGVITAITADHGYTDRESGEYIDSFNNSVSSTSVGQSLSSYSPSRIGGASLTTAAFDEALNAIRADAAA